MSGDFLTVELLKERKLLQDLDAIPDDIRAILRDKMSRWTRDLATLVSSNIADRLKRVSGRLEDSVDWEFTDDGLMVSGHVFIHGVPYARAQEEGAQTPPHVILPRNGKILAFMAASGDKVFATRVLHPGGVIPPKHFMKDAYREMSPKITSRLYDNITRKLKRRFSNG
jgi:hypothetical protein